MNKILEEITASVLVYPTSSTAISGSASKDMTNYRNAVAKACFHRLPDQKGDPCTVVLAIYENVGTGATGTKVSASVITGTLTSIADVYLETEISVDQMTDGKRYVGVYLTSTTSTALTAEIDRSNPRYSPV